MELHQLRYLDALARTGSFTRAATECHVTQPTLSHQVKKLEKEMGGRLLHRRRQGARLTVLGERLREHARAILGSVEAARREASSLNRRVEGRLRLGIIPTVAPYLLPRLLRRCRKHYPGLVFEITESPTAGLVAALTGGELDAVILSPPIETSPALNLRLLFEDEFFLALPLRHPLTARARVRVAELRRENMILLGDDHCLRGQALALCRRAGYQPRIALQSAQLDTVLGLVESGLGLTFVPASALGSLRHRRVKFRSLGPEKAARQVSLAWLHPAVAPHVLEAVAELAQERGRRVGPSARPATRRRADAGHLPTSAAAR